MPTFTGTAEADVIDGTEISDVIYGLDGNDVLRGLGYSDVIYGGRGADRIEGGESLNYLYGGERGTSDADPDPGDILIGGSARDYISAGFGDDIDGVDGSDILVDFDGTSAPEAIVVDFTVLLDGGSVTVLGGLIRNIDNLGQVRLSAFDDVVTGYTGTRRNFDATPELWGEAGNDTLIGNPFAEVLRGGIGDDVLYGIGGNDRLNGGGNEDRLDGGLGSDEVNGQEGDDDLTGGAGADRLSAGEGDDVVRADAADALADGGEGFDILHFDAAAATAGLDVDFTALLAGGTLTIGGTTLQGIEALAGLTGSALADTVVLGTPAPPPAGTPALVARLGGGADVATASAAGGTILGEDGDDALTGLAAADTLEGGAGDDLLLGGKGVDTLAGGDGADTLDGGSAGDVMAGGLGDDRYHVHAGDTVVEAADGGYDTVHASLDWAGADHVERVFLAGGADGLGGAGDNALAGGVAANRLAGEGGDDVLRGYGGADMLDGGAGNDILWGGALRDMLTGGTGADGFRFQAGDGSTLVAQSDWIRDFSRAEGDRIYLNLIDADAAAAGDQAFAFIGAAAFSGTAGELRATATAAGYTLVEVDTNGDTTPDLLLRVTTSAPLMAGDFAL